MKTAIFSGGLAFASGISCGAVAYAARTDAGEVIMFVCFLALVFGFLAFAKDAP